MLRRDEITAIKAEMARSESTPSSVAIKGDPCKTIATTIPDSIKDSGRVHIGGGMMHF
jgi:hypothetical protein